MDIAISGYKAYNSLNEKYLDIIIGVNKQPKLKEYNKINDIYNKSIDCYVNNICELVNELLENMEYNKLNAVLDEALKYVDSNILKDLKNKYGIIHILMAAELKKG